VVNKLPVLKDDVAYEDIWRFYHGTPEQRSVLAKYCAHDTDVCLALMDTCGMMATLVAQWWVFSWETLTESAKSSCFRRARCSLAGRCF